MPNSPRIITTVPGPLAPGPVITTNGTSPKGASGLIRQPIPSSSRPLLQYSGEYAIAQHQPPPPQPQPQQPPPPPPPNPIVAPPVAATTALATPIPMHESLRRYVVNGTSRFFGVNGEESNEKVWMERRRRLAIKLFGGVKDDFHLEGNIGGAGGGSGGAFEDSLVSRVLVSDLSIYQNGHVFFPWCLSSLTTAMEYDYAMIRSPLS